MTVTIEVKDDSLHYRSKCVKPDGRIAVAEYTGSFDGRAVTVTGSSGLLAPVSLTRLDAYHIKASYLRGLQVVATSLWTIDQGGTQMTITTESPDALEVRTQTVVHLTRAPNPVSSG